MTHVSGVALPHRDSLDSDVPIGKVRGGNDDEKEDDDEKMGRETGALLLGTALPLRFHDIRLCKGG
jgi:hypothetical protein